MPRSRREQAQVHLGCSGWTAARRRYFREFGTVEVQHTFYEPPRLKTLTRWRDEAPPGFRFTIKCFQAVTHEATSPTYRRMRRKIARPDALGSFRDTPEVWAAWEETLAAARALKADVILLQTPASFTPTPSHLANLRKFCRRAGRDSFLLAFEPRGLAWDPDAADRLCAEFALVRACDPFATRPPDGKIAYFRLHGIGGYRYRFTDADLERLRDLVSRYREAWIFFNNLAMWDDALRLKDLLSDRGVASVSHSS